ncbi:hypothetical protein [Neptunicella sp. SCSIO 80796]|uniref:hypothetical protein n=1 Tax=Neptunicella plasticusilytica TaxID=3117012 RepID=UPI003A4D7149
MSEHFHCWQCGNRLTNVILPMSRREECTGCGADQHVCRMCEHFDSSGWGSCNEERAEPVSDRESANFCDYFVPSSDARTPLSQKHQQAKAKLAALFGDEPNDTDAAKKQEGNLSPAEIAEQKLREMLGG